MIDNLILFLDQNLSSLWLSVFLVYLAGFVVTLLLSFASAMNLGYEPKSCSACAVSCIMIPLIVVWPLFWIIVIVALLLKAKNSEE